MFTYYYTRSESMLKIKSAQFPQQDFTDPYVRRVASGLIEIQETANQAVRKLEQYMVVKPHMSMEELSELLSYELRQIEMMTGRFTSF